MNAMCWEVWLFPMNAQIFMKTTNKIPYVLSVVEFLVKAVKGLEHQG